MTDTERSELLSHLEKMEADITILQQPTLRWDVVASLKDRIKMLREWAIAAALEK